MKNLKKFESYDKEGYRQLTQGEYEKFVKKLEHVVFDEDELKILDRLLFEWSREEDSPRILFKRYYEGKRHSEWVAQDSVILWLGGLTHECWGIKFSFTKMPFLYTHYTFYKLQDDWFAVEVQRHTEYSKNKIKTIYEWFVCDELEGLQKLLPELKQTSKAEM